VRRASDGRRLVDGAEEEEVAHLVRDGESRLSELPREIVGARRELDERDRRPARAAEALARAGSRIARMSGEEEGVRERGRVLSARAPRRDVAGVRRGARLVRALIVRLARDE